MDYIEIGIRHFSKYIKRGDIKTPNWFAVDHNILLHPDFFGLSGDEFKVFIWVVGVAAHLNSDKIRVYPDVCASQIRVTKKTVVACIEKLKGKRWDVTDLLRECTGNNEAACTTGEGRTGKDSEGEDTSEPASRSDLTLTDSPLGEYENKVSDEIKAQWLKTYPDQDWIEFELRKAVTWIKSNPERSPKSRFANFFSRWLARDWESHRQKLKPIKTSAGAWSV